jgi:chromosome segregation ATPase
LEDEDDFHYDYSKVARSVDRGSDSDITLEEAKKYVLESIKRRDDIKGRLKDMTTNVQNEAVIASERDKIGRLTTDIDRLQRDIADKLARQKEASEDFDSIAEKRRQRLMSLLELMQARIGFIFKTLCMDERAAAGFLLENTYIPFLDGIIFNATPPAKKFTIGTEGLSSGEASMANVALFLCFNDIKRSSVVLFDEIDAHMDAENVFRLVNTLGKSARIAQVVVVSHKPFLYSRSQVLLGITRHPTKDSSTCFSHRIRPKVAAEKV